MADQVPVAGFPILQGVADALIEALRRAGGGTVVMCDTEASTQWHAGCAALASCCSAVPATICVCTGANDTL